MLACWCRVTEPARQGGEGERSFAVRPTSPRASTLGFVGRTVQMLIAGKMLPRVNPLPAD